VKKDMLKQMVEAAESFKNSPPYDPNNSYFSSVDELRFGQVTNFLRTEETTPKKEK
jgi:hypothetical protein